MDPGRLDVFDNSHDVDVFTVTNGINLCFVSPAQKMIDQYAIVWKVFENAQNVAFQFVVVDHNPHPLSSQYIRWTDEHRITDPFRYFDGFINRSCYPIFR